MKKLTITPQTKFNRLSVINEAEPYIWNKIKIRKFECRCDCGNLIVVKLNHLRNGNTKSCGCLNDEKRTQPKKIKHYESNHKRTVEYYTWISMKQRCYNSKAKNFKRYGGRGINVCDRWLNSFEYFLEDMGRRPIGHSIDRINNNSNYEPTNCKWSTVIEQANNKG